MEKEYSLSKPRVYTSKAKGAQRGSQKAIRPVNLALKPSEIKPYVDNMQYKLYSLFGKEH